MPCDELTAGEAGFLFANIKTVSDAQIGDTIIDDANPATEPLPGFQEIKPMVFDVPQPDLIDTRLADRHGGPFEYLRATVRIEADSVGHERLDRPLWRASLRKGGYGSLSVAPQNCAAVPEGARHCSPPGHTNRGFQSA